MTDWFVGQKVVCISAFGNLGAAPWSALILPAVGFVYGLRAALCDVGIAARSFPFLFDPAGQGLASPAERGASDRRALPR